MSSGSEGNSKNTKNIASYTSNMHEDDIKAARDQTLWRRTGVNWAAMHRRLRVCLHDAAVMLRRLIPSAHAVCVFAGLCYGSSFVKTNQSQWARKHKHTRPRVDSQAQPHTHFRISELNFHNLPNLRILLLGLQVQFSHTHTQLSIQRDTHNVWLQFI